MGKPLADQEAWNGLDFSLTTPMALSRVLPKRFLVLPEEERGGRALPFSGLDPHREGPAAAGFDGTCQLALPLHQVRCLHVSFHFSCCSSLTSDASGITLVRDAKFFPTVPLSLVL